MNEKPNQTDFQREQAVFLAAVEAATPTDRNAVLDRECGDDAGLRRRVEALLAAHDAEGSLPPAGAAVDETCALESMPGAMIAARYKLLEEIGEGGMGVVWMAEQRVPVRRLVAVKLIKAGMDSKSVIARFEAERQALAMMDHPNIARVFDGGMTEQGRPYFAMELVRGLPVTQYCDQRRMTVHDRLLVFTQICHAVQHAHQKGIIHRDIKPNNVLVTEHDGQPVPKVIDFGLAKALGGSGVLTEHTLYTAFGQMAGTPLYTAPEQVAINSLDIDTRADIYALGVLLYELLTGSPPLDRERLKEAAWDEICRVIREEEPPRPSTRLSTSMILPNLAASRQTEPAKLCGLIRGDLDWIILKALEKERRLRYDTATALVADIEHHLNDEPVVAAPPTVGYRARKFVRKHRRSVIATAVLAGILILGIIGTSWGLWKATVATNRLTNAHDDAMETLKGLINRFWVSERESSAGYECLRTVNYKKADKPSSTGYSIVYDGKHDPRIEFFDCDENSHHRIPPSLQGTLHVFKSLVDDAMEGEEEANKALKAANLQLTHALDSAELEAYIANIALCQTAMENGIWSEAHRRLDACPMSKRGFEWKFLSEKMPSVVGELPDGYGLSPDGRFWLAKWSLQSLQLLDMSGNSVGDPMIYDGNDAVFSPNGRLIVARLENGNTQLWDITGKPVGDPIKTGNIMLKDVCSSDGQHVLTMPDEQTIQLQDVSGRIVGDMMKHRGTINTVFFSPDGHLLFTASKDGTARLWDVAGKPVGEIMREGGSFEVARFSPDGKLLMTLSDNKIVRLWNLMGKPVGEPLKNERLEPSFYWPRFSQDSKIVITHEGEGMGSSEQYWNIHGKPLSNDAEYYVFQSAGFSPDGRLRLTLADDGCAIQLYDATTGKAVGEPMRSESSFNQAFFSPDGKLVLATCNNDGIVRLWDLNGTPVGEPMLHPGSKQWLKASFTLDGRRILTSCFDQLYVWDLQGRQLGITHGISSYVFHPDNETLIANSNMVYRIDHLDLPMISFDFDVSLARDEIIALDEAAHRTSITSTASMPARTIHRPTTGNIIELVASGVDSIFLRHDQKVTAAALSPNGLRAVTATGRIIRFWDTVSGREIAEITSNISDSYIDGMSDISTNTVQNLQFTPDGNQLILTLGDDSVQIWDSRSFKERQQDRDARFAEFKPARQYVDQLLTTTKPNDQLADVIRKDKSLNPIRKVQALHWLGNRLKGIDAQAKEVLEKISCFALKRGELYEDLATVKCPPRVAEQVTKSIAEWKEPSGQDLLNQATLVFVQPGLQMKRYMTAFQAVAANVGSAPTDTNVLLVLGEGNYRVGQFEEAVKNLSRSAEMILAAQHRTDRTEWAFIAMAQFKLGRLDEARQSLAKMRVGTLDPNSFPDTELEAEAISLIEPESTQPNTSPDTKIP